MRLTILRFLPATDEARLRSEFSQFGTVTEVFLPVERGTSRPRGFGFVTLASRDMAERAITQMDQSQLDGVSVQRHTSTLGLRTLLSDIVSFVSLYSVLSVSMNRVPRESVALARHPAVLHRSTPPERRT